MLRIVERESPEQSTTMNARTSVPDAADFGYTVEAFNMSEERDTGLLRAARDGRIAGKGGKTKFAIENATRTRIVLADSKIHVLGSFANIKIARDAVCDLILGTQPGKVYTKLRSIASRLKERF